MLEANVQVMEYVIENIVSTFYWSSDSVQWRNYVGQKPATPFYVAVVMSLLCR